MEAELGWKKYKEKIVESQVLLRPTQRKKQNFIQHLITVHEIINRYDEADYLKPLKFVKPGSTFMISPYYILATRLDIKERKSKCLKGSIPSV